MPVECSADGCQIPVTTATEGLEAQRAALEAEKDSVIAQATAHVDALTAQLAKLDAAIKAEAKADDFPLCGNHVATLSVDVASAMVNTRGAGAAVRREVIAAAREDLAVGRMR